MTDGTTIRLGVCDNSSTGMFYGGLVPKGPSCHGSAASCVVVYQEIVGNTVETTKLCEKCLGQMRQEVRALRARARLRPARGTDSEFAWQRKLTVFKPEQVQASHVRALVRGYKRVPKSLRARFNLE